MTDEYSMNTLEEINDPSQSSSGGRILLRWSVQRIYPESPLFSLNVNICTSESLLRIEPIASTVQSELSWPWHAPCQTFNLLVVGTLVTAPGGGPKLTWLRNGRTFTVLESIRRAERSKETKSEGSFCPCVVFV